MSLRRGLRCLCVTLLVLSSLFFALNGAQALLADEKDLAFVRGQEGSVEIISFKAWLRDEGFYQVGISDDALQSFELDNLTMAAVQQVCKFNPELTFYENGVSWELIWRWNGMVKPALITPNSMDFHMGDEHERIEQIQNRLNALGYDEAGYSFAQGIYDDALQKTIDEFVRCNKLTYDPNDGINAAMQELLFSENAVAYVPEEETRSLPEKVLAYWSASSMVFGLEIPNYALWAVGFVLLCVIVLLMIKLLSGGGKEKNDGKDSQNTGKRANGKLRPGTICFTIEYHGEQCVYYDDIKNYVRIGRQTGKFPLNLEDGRISRKHCEIYYLNGDLRLKDFSSYGTTVNGELCHSDERVLHSGDVLGVGDHSITVEF